MSIQTTSHRRPFVTVLLILWSVAASASPRALSDAEREAVQILSSYLSRGPAAVVEKLAADSPLRKFPAKSLHEEIEVRLGPPAGAVWELQTVVPALQDKAAAFNISFPSGIDETVIVELKNVGGSWQIGDLRILAQPSTQPPPFPRVPVSNRPAESRSEVPANALALVAGLLGAALSAGAAFVRRASRAVAAGMLAGAGVLFSGAVAIAHIQSAKTKTTAVTVDDSGDESLAPLLAMRREMAAGRSDAQPAAPPACRARVCGDAAALWSAQAKIQQMRLAEARAILARFPSPSPIPLAEILRGRLALLELDEVAAAVAFEHAVSLGPGRDGLWYEAAQALGSLGYDDRAERYFRRIERVGSRDSDVYYTLAMYSAIANRPEEAGALLKEGWNLQPVERARVVEAPALWSIIRRPEVLQFVSLSATAEAQFSSPGAMSRPIQLPVEAEPFITGDFLQIGIGEAEMLVPGGAALAPVGTPVADAATRARAEEERGIADVPQLSVAARTPGALAQPALRRRFTRSAQALAERNRWAELAALTEGLTPKSEHVPPEIFFLRNEALRRVERLDDAKQLMTELADSRVLQRRRDAQALEQLGEALAAHDLYDKAISMLDRAQQIRANPFTDDRVRQLQMNKRLATKYSVHTTEHFEVRFPEDVSVVAAQQIGRIMEDEFTRLQRWVPVREFKRTVVNVLWWQEFRSTYTGNDFILGFYEGKITVPFAGVQRYVPAAVSLLTHELCHAMVGQATLHQAPHWFQEGLAQRVEMIAYHANAFNMYDDERLITVPLLDSVLTGSPDPEMIGGAYIQSQTVIRFIEAEWGAGAMGKLIEQFRAGASTEEAIRAVTGLAMTDFETRHRAWGRGGKRVFENPPPRRYDVEEQNIHFSKRGNS